MVERGRGREQGRKEGKKGEAEKRLEEVVGKGSPSSCLLFLLSSSFFSFFFFLLLLSSSQRGIAIYREWEVENFLFSLLL